MRIGCALACGLVLLPLAGAQAQAAALDEALALAKGRAYDQAAVACYDLLQRARDPTQRGSARLCLADAMRAMRLWVPALYGYAELVEAGRADRNYAAAAQGLLATQTELHDPLFVPSLINAHLDAEALGQLGPEQVAQINYLIGELSLRERKTQDARDFLRHVPRTSAFYPKALYLLAILDVRDGKLEDSLEGFRAIAVELAETAGDLDAEHLRNLALLAAGRTAYSLGRSDEAIGFYGQVPRYSEEWFTSLYERAWAHFRLGEYGKTLGLLHSVHSPYFAKRHAPEAYVVEGTTFFVNCQWDRVRRSVEHFKAKYEPMLSTLTAYLNAGREPAAYYRDVVASGGGRFAEELAREVRSSRRFKDLHFMLAHAAWERTEIANLKAWQGSRLAEETKRIVEAHQTEIETAAGALAHTHLRNLQAMLQHLQGQVGILDFEVADAERQWLEQGKEILKGRRARLPRPDIPNDQWQHWSFDGEYRQDELGFVQYSLRSECF